jgi:hypothetical protein
MIVTITRPPDGTNYDLCASSSACGAQTCTRTATTREMTWTGECGENDDRYVYFSVRSPGATDFDCHGYVLTVSFQAWLSDGSWPGCPGGA